MLSAAELGITIKERNAAIKVRDGLASGEYRHIEEENFDSAKPNGKPGFNMVDYELHRDCGTIACIGGWIRITMRKKKRNYYYFSDGFMNTDLFGPNSKTIDWDKITPTKAAKAIDNFLNGKEPWDFMRPKAKRLAA